MITNWHAYLLLGLTFGHHFITILAVASRTAEHEDDNHTLHRCLNTIKRDLSVNRAEEIVNAEQRMEQKWPSKQGSTTTTWRSYNFLMDNCLVKLYVILQRHRYGAQPDNTGLEIEDFSSLLSTLERLIGDNQATASRQLDNITARIRQSEGPGGGLMRSEIKLKRTLQEFRRRKLILDKLLEEARVAVSVMEIEIDTQMELCLLSSPVAAINSAQEIGAEITGGGKASVASEAVLAKCTKKLEDVDESETLVRARALCQRLRAQISLQQLLAHHLQAESVTTSTG